MLHRITIFSEGNPTAFRADTCFSPLLPGLGTVFTQQPFRRKPRQVREERAGEKRYRKRTRSCAWGRNGALRRRGDGGSKGPRRARVQLWPERWGAHVQAGTGLGEAKTRTHGKTPGPFFSSPHTNTKETGFSRKGPPEQPCFKNSQEGSKSGNALTAHASLRQPFLTRLLTFDRTSYETVQLERFFKTELRAPPEAVTSMRFNSQTRISEARTRV